MTAMFRGVGLVIAAFASTLLFAAAGGSATEPSLIVFPATPESGGATQLFSVQPNGDGLKPLNDEALKPTNTLLGKRQRYIQIAVVETGDGEIV